MMYAEQLAQELYTQNPNFDLAGRAEALFAAAWPLAVRDLGITRARWEFGYDEDFAGDLTGAYAHFQKSVGTNLTKTAG
jgi:uncharacterized protein (DUF885 family)